MNSSILEKYTLDCQAAGFLKNIVQFCILSKTEPEVIAMLNCKKNQSIPLSMLAEKLPIASLGLYQQAKMMQTTIITADIIALYYCGFWHIMEAYEKIHNTRRIVQIVAKTGQLFSTRLKELGINLQTDTEKTRFFLADIAFIGQIINITKHAVNIKIKTNNETFFLNNVLKNIDVNKNEIVITHLGTISCKIGLINPATIKRIHKEQEESEYLQRAIKKITKRRDLIIDFKNFNNSNLFLHQMENQY